MNPLPIADSKQADGGTMRTIANKLNISVSTVSRALRRVPGINAETRAQVFQTAAQLGYRLPKSYRPDALDSKKLQHIGVLIETPEAHLPAPYLTGMSEASMVLNASLVIHYVKPEHCDKILNPAYQPRAMQSGLLSGMVLIFRWPTDIVREFSRMLPTVSITHQYTGVDLDTVGIDNFGGIAMLVRRLHELGHRKIGFVGRCGELHWSSVRFGAYVAALTNLGLEFRPEWVVDVDTEHLTYLHLGADQYAEQVARLIDDGVRAWICVAEPVGWRLHSWLTARNIRVPEDVSITGFHRPDTAPLSEPSLTSVTASYQAMGAAALKRLLYRIQNPAESTRTILFPCHLYDGDSVGKPPA